ncbi:alpha/beta-hydrolase [Hypoxylon trugodes]|uniref:alpha/beta-hydrolase n=1 Tax=Hypoxylon trugodes TaxID=326681 RepID=UPI0021961074|nr:alpha/beta-hydrolase [Hypoxylon trugodes]KAI1385336.1 alpha/beta-hydrolase [Hypoxylon trugodes]
MELGCSVVTPLSPHPHTHTVVFLHGRGDTSQNMADALLRWTRDSRGRPLVDAFPSVRWVFPQAEPRLAETLGEVWPQWFDIWNTLDMTDREDLQAFGLRGSVASIAKIVRREARSVGGMHRVVLAGVSQGGATAVHTLLHLDGKPEGGEVEEIEDETAAPPPKKLCALMVFSSWLPFPGGSLDETREVLGLELLAPRREPSEGAEEGEVDNQDEVVKNTPAFLGHNSDDPLVFVEFGRQLRDGLKSFGMDVQWREYNKGGHWINVPDGVNDAIEFLIAQGVPVAK